MLYNKTILIIDDDKAICDLLQQILAKKNINSFVANNTTQALSLLEYIKFDLLLLDYMLPNENGIDFLKKINQKHHKLPIIMLTATHNIDTKIDALELGAFDYITKPFNFVELFLRINKAIEINQTPYKNEDLYSDGIDFNYNERVLTINNKSISLTEDQSNIFNFFWLNPNKILSKEEIISSLDKTTESNLNVSIMRLRKKIKTIDPKTEYLKTIRYKGFTLVK
jgi:DNA-binding response OmpR family regulator